MPAWGADSWATRAAEYEHRQGGAKLKRGDDGRVAPRHWARSTMFADSPMSKFSPETDELSHLLPVSLPQRAPVET
jgi:hypothetical protein